MATHENGCEFQVGGDLAKLGCNLYKGFYCCNPFLSWGVKRWGVAYDGDATYNRGFTVYIS